MRHSKDESEKAAQAKLDELKAGFDTQLVQLSKMQEQAEADKDATEEERQKLVAQVQQLERERQRQISVLAQKEEVQRKMDEQLVQAAEKRQQEEQRRVAKIKQQQREAEAAAEAARKKAEEAEAKRQQEVDAARKKAVSVKLPSHKAVVGLRVQVTKDANLLRAECKKSGMTAILNNWTASSRSKLGGIGVICEVAKSDNTVNLGGRVQWVPTKCLMTVEPSGGASKAAAKRAAAAGGGGAVAAGGGGGKAPGGRAGQREQQRRNAAQQAESRHESLCDNSGVCCFCQDKRPNGSTDTTYVDGQGQTTFTVTAANRTRHYCPKCCSGDIGSCNCGVGFKAAEESAVRSVHETDDALPRGTFLFVPGHGRGEYRSFNRWFIGANEHTICFDTGGMKTVKLKGVKGISAA
jgi:hypothetical protein